MSDSTQAVQPPHALFSLGSVVATPGALQALERHGVDPLTLLQRHITGDFGDLDDEDQQANHIAVAQGSRILSAYIVTGSNGSARIYVITEWDRSVTTLLLTSEY